MTLIRVTREHIAKGTPKNGCACPIALALRAAGFQVHVTPYFILTGRRTVPLPYSARDFIGMFDSGKAPVLEPFDFEVPL